MRAPILVVMLVACGDDGATTRDASVDTPDDAPADAATAVNMKVTLGNRDPAPNIDVVFHDDSGAPLATMKTDATGNASSALTGIAMVTTLGVNPDTNGRELYTVTGVLPGDQLESSVNWGYDDGGPTVQVAVFQLAYPDNPPSGTDGWKFSIPSGSITTGSPIGQSLPVFSYGLREGTTNIVDGIAYAMQGTTPLAYIPMSGITVAASGDTSVDMSIKTWRTDFATYQSDYTNLPPGTTSARPEMTIDSHGSYVIPGNPPEQAATPGTTVGHTFAFAKDIGTTMLFSTLELYFGSAPRAWAIYTKAGPVRASDTFDTSQILLPAIVSTAATDTTTTNPTVSYSTAAPATAADAGFIYLNWTDASWVFMFPGSVTSVRAPTLPDSLAAFRPPTDGSIDSSPFVVLIENDFSAGYADVKANVARPTNYVESSIRYPL